MSAGCVKSWKEERGFGFITEDNGEDVFVHVKSLPKGVKQLAPDTRVQFEKRKTPRGVQAFGVVIMSGEPEGEEDEPDVLFKAEYLRELNAVLPPLREVHKLALLDIAVKFGWVEE